MAQELIIILVRLLLSMYWSWWYYIKFVPCFAGTALVKILP